jgi:hypothetical protein
VTLCPFNVTAAFRPALNAFAVIKSTLQHTCLAEHNAASFRHKGFMKRCSLTELHNSSSARNTNLPLPLAGPVALPTGGGIATKDVLYAATRQLRADVVDKRNDFSYVPQGCVLCVPTRSSSVSIGVTAGKCDPWQSC